MIIWGGGGGGVGGGGGGGGVEGGEGGGEGEGERNRINKLRPWSSRCVSKEEEPVLRQVFFSLKSS